MTISLLLSLNKSNYSEVLTEHSPAIILNVMKEKKIWDGLGLTKNSDC